MNNPPDGAPAQLRHAEWHGFTAADAVFPAFLFVMGAGMAPALGRFRAKPISPTLVRIARRGALLVAIGLALNLLYAGSGPLRYPGVLQRIGLTYVIAAAVVMWATRAVPAVIAVLLVGWTWVLVAFGSLTPEDNIAGAFDRAVFGAQHLYRGGPTDPEGLLATFAAVATVLLGWGAGRRLERHDRTRRALAELLFGGVLLIVAGVALSWVVPINKRLWTSSFVLVSAGVAALALAGLHAISATRAKAALEWVLLPFGLNALAIYTGSEVVSHLVPVPSFADYLMLWWLVALVLWRRNIILKV